MSNFPPIFFKNQADFRAWLAAHHATESDLLVGFYKVGSNKESMTWPESVDQALCFGWIDGIRRTIDGESYSIRFSPRRKNSIWSDVNIKKVEELTRLGLMQPAGEAIYATRKESKSRIYSFENEAIPLSTAFEVRFRVEEEAWTYFIAQAPSYKKTIIYWVMTAKRTETQESRFQGLLEACKQKKRLR